MGVNAGGMGQGFQRGFPGMWPQASSVNVEDMNSAIRATEFLSNELGTIKGNWGKPEGMSEAEWMKQYEKHRANITAGINDMLGQARLGLDNLNRNNLDAKSKEMVLEMMSMATAARNLAAYNNDQAPLLDGAKAVADSLASLMNLLGNALDNPDDYAESLEEALKAAEKLFQGAEALMNISLTDYKLDKGAELLVADIIANIDVTLNDLLLKAKLGAGTLSPEKKAELQNSINRLQAIKGLALAQMKQLAPVLQDPAAQKHLKIAAATLGTATDGLSNRATALGVSNAVDISDAVLRINRALELLLNSDKLVETRGLAGDVDLYGPVQQLISDLVAVRSNLDDPRTVIANVRAAANDQNAIVEATQALSDGADPETQNRLTKSAAALTKNTEILMDQTRALIKDTSNEKNRHAVVGTVSDMEKIALQLLGDAGTTTAVNNLRYASKVAVASLLKLTTAAAIYDGDVRDSAVRAHLEENVTSSNDLVTDLIAKVQAAASDPRNYNVQSELLDCALSQLPNHAELVSTSKQATLHIIDSNKRQDLDLTATETSNNLRLVAQAIANVSKLKGDAALESAYAEFDIIRADLAAAKVWAEAGQLKPVPGHTKASAQALVSIGAKQLRDQVALLSADAQKGNVNNLTEPVEQAAQAFQQIAAAARPLAAAASRNPRDQAALIEKVQDALEATVANVTAARALAVDTKSKPKKAAVDKAFKELSNQVDNLEALSKGASSSIDDVLLTLQTKLQLLGAKMALNPDLSYGDMQKDLLAATKAMDIAVDQLATTARDNPENLSYALDVLGATVGNLLEREAMLISASGEGEAADQLALVGKAIADKTGILVKNAQAVAANKNAKTEAQLDTTVSQVHQNLSKLKSMLASGNEIDVALGDILLNIALSKKNELQVVPGTAADLLSEIIAETKEMQRVAANVQIAASKDIDTVVSFADDIVHAANALVGTAQAATLSGNSGKYASLDGARIVIGAELIAKNPGLERKVHTLARQVTQAAGNLIGEAKARARTEPDSAKRTAIVKLAQALIQSASQLARAAGNRNPQRDGREISKAATDLANKSIELENSIRTGKKTSDTVDPNLANQLVSKAQEVAHAASDLLQSAANNAGSSNQGEVNGKKSTVEQKLAAFKEIVGALNPAVQAADSTLASLKKASADLEGSLASAQAGKLTGDLKGKSLAEHQDALGEALAAIGKDIANVSTASGTGPDAVAKAVKALGVNANGLVQALNLVAVATPDEGVKVQVIALGKALVDSLADLLKGVQASNLNDPTADTLLANSAKAGQQAIRLLQDQLNAGSAPLEQLEEFREKIVAALKQLSLNTSAISNYTNNRAVLLDQVRDFAAQATTLLSVDKTNGNRTRNAIVSLAESVPLLVAAANACAATAADQSTKTAIIAAAKAMGEAAATMVGDTKGAAEGKGTEPQLLASYNKATAAVAQLLNATKSGAAAETKVDEALEANRKAVIALSASVMLAEARELAPTEEDRQASMSSLLEKLAADTKDLTQAAGAVAASSKGSDDDLAKDSLALAMTSSSLASSSVRAISRLTSSEDQAAALQAAKAIAVANSDLLLASRAYRRHPDDANAEALAAAHNAVVNSVKNLHSTLDNSAAQLTVHEKQIDDQKKEILAFLTSAPKTKASPEDVVKSAREVIQATADLYFAESDQDAVTAAMNSASYMGELIGNINGAKDLATQDAVKHSLDDASVGVIKSVAAMLDLGKKNRDDDETKAEMEKQSEVVTAAVNDLIFALRRLPGAENLTLEGI